jgi:hypothetical protein
MHPGEDRRQLCDPRPAVTHHYNEHLRRRADIEPELDLAAAGIFEGIAGDFRNRGGNPRLILPLESDQFGQTPGPLADQDDVRFCADRNQEEALFHAAILKHGPHRDH